MSSKQSNSLSKSQLFSVYNRARASGLDRPRVNRALGLLQAGKVRRINATTFAVEGDGCTYTVINGRCTCKDAQYRSVACKHLVATWILRRMETSQAPAAAPIPSPARVTEQELEDAISLLYGVA